MPAASSKPTPQNAPKEAPDFPTQLVAMIEKKIRNLEKRKLKLQSYQDMVKSGQELTKDQIQAASHFDEVCSNLDFAKELQKNFQTTINDNNKVLKKLAKRENAQRHEQELQRIRDIILLNSVLNNLGTDHVRNDFLAGANGAVKLTDDQVNHLDEFYKLVIPSREDDEESEGKEKSSVSFETKLTEASEHLDSYIKADKKEVLGTTYKELKELVQEINSCGYLDNIPAPPEEEPAGEGEEDAPPPPTQGSGNDEETAEEDYIVVQQDQVPSPEAPEVVSSLPPAVLPPQEPEPPMSRDSRVAAPAVDQEAFPKPIEMPPQKLKSQGSDVLASVQHGSFNFMQDSMLDYDSPHMDPAVVATGQSYHPSQGYSALNHQQAVNEQSMQQHQSMDQLSQAQTMDLPLSDPAHPSPLPTHPAYEAQSGLVSDPGYGMASPFETQQQKQQASLAQQQQQQQQQSLGHQGLGQQSLGQPGSLPGQRGQQSGLGVQQTLDTMSQSQTMMSTQQQQQQQQQKRNDLPEFPSPPADAQLTKSEETSSSLQASMLGQHSAGMGTGSSYSQTLSADPASQHTNQMVPPPSLTDHAPATLQHHDMTAAQAHPNAQAQKSTMNASAPVFQMTNSSRSSPQMQAMQQSAMDQSQTEMGTFQSADATPPTAASAEKPTDRDSPKPETTASTMASQQREQEESPEQPSDNQSSDSPGQSSYSSYQSYQSSSSYRGNGRGNPRGARGTMNSTGYRGGNRGGGMPYMSARSAGRYPSNPNPNPRGPGGYNSYLPRDNFQQRAPDMPYGNTNPNFNTFNRPQDPNFNTYSRRPGPPRGSPRGTRGGPTGVRGQANFRGRGGSSGFKPQSSQVTV
ncbi:caprin-1-like [Patiria miniata]|uniref:Caprin-1 dimerization domain-containing protein n=1 Tax=Patiria miniata TaxID=46514 RepID=A0A913ZPB6_PATMI|nr:caprin-1-like [Patiria miniata]